MDSSENVIIISDSDDSSSDSAATTKQVPKKNIHQRTAAMMPKYASTRSVPPIRLPVSKVSTKAESRRGGSMMPTDYSSSVPVKPTGPAPETHTKTVRRRCVAMMRTAVPTKRPWKKSVAVSANISPLPPQKRIKEETKEIADLEEVPTCSSSITSDSEIKEEPPIKEETDSESEDDDDNYLISMDSESEDDDDQFPKAFVMLSDYSKDAFAELQSEEDDSTDAVPSPPSSDEFKHIIKEELMDIPLQQPGTSGISCDPLACLSSVKEETGPESEEDQFPKVFSHMSDYHLDTLGKLESEEDDIADAVPSPPSSDEFKHIIKEELMDVKIETVEIEDDPLSPPIIEIE